MNELWARYSDSAAQESQPTSGAATSQAAWERRRQAYADLRDLMRLESAARKLRYSYYWQSPPLASEQPGSSSSIPAHDEASSHVAAGPTDDVSAVWEPGLRTSSNYPVWLVVDQRMTMFYGSRRRTKSVVAARAAALVAWCMLGQSRSVGALVFNDEGISCFNAHSSRLHVTLILHAILNQNHSLAADAGFVANPRMLNEALHRMETLVTSGNAIFLITDASGYDDETAMRIARLAERNRLFLVLVYDPRQVKRPTIGSFLGDDCMRRVKSGRGARLMRGEPDANASADRRVFPVGVPLFRFSTREDAVKQVSRAFKALNALSETHNRALASAILRSHPAPDLEIVLQRSGLGAGDAVELL